LINHNNNDGSISYDEVSYLSVTDDLLSFGNEEDAVSETIQSFIENVVTWFKENVIHHVNSRFSRSGSVQINSHYHVAGPGIQIASGLARAFIFLFAIVAPPLILADVSSMAARLATISIFTGVVIVLLLWMKKEPGSTDILMISATYAAGLMMFMSSNTGLLSWAT